MKPSTLWKDPDNRLLLLVLLLLAAVLPGYTWHEDTSGFITDDAIYLMMADFFSPYFDGNIYVETLNMLRTRFPPAFPIFIGLLGGGSQNMGAAHLVTGMTFLLAALFFYIWVRTTLDRPKLALACLVIFALLPETLIFVLELRSEFLYLAFLFAALIAVDAADRSERHTRELLLAAAGLVGLCILTRIIGICLLGAFVLHLFTNREPRKYLYMATAAALPACWYVIKTVNDYSNMYTEDVARYFSYDGLWRLVASDIPHNASAMYAAWGKNLGVRSDASWFLETLVLLLLFVALVGFIHRLRRCRLDAFYLVFYIAIILMWPHPDHMTRFVYPLVPIALLYIFAAVPVIARMNNHAPASMVWQNAALVALILLMIVPNATAVASRFIAPVPEHIPEDFRHTRNWLEDGNTKHIREGAEAKSRVIALLKRVGPHLKENECVYTDHRPLTMLYTQRPGVRLPRDLSPGRLWRCKYLFVMNLVAQHGPRYPLDVIDHDRLELVDIEYDSQDRQQAYLFRIRR